MSKEKRGFVGTLFPFCIWIMEPYYSYRYICGMAVLAGTDVAIGTRPLVSCPSVRQRPLPSPAVVFSAPQSALSPPRVPFRLAVLLSPHHHSACAPAPSLSPSLPLSLPLRRRFQSSLRRLIPAAPRTLSSTNGHRTSRPTIPSVYPSVLARAPIVKHNPQWRSSTH